MGSLGEILNWTCMASSIILVICLIELVLGKKLAKAYQNMLWSIVLLRLLLPNMPSSSLSLFNLVPLSTGVIHNEEVRPESTFEANQEDIVSVGVSAEGFNEVDQEVAEVIQNKDEHDVANKVLDSGVISQEVMQNTDLDNQVMISPRVDQSLYRIWLIEVIMLGSYYTYGYMRARKKFHTLEAVEDETILIWEKLKK